MSLGFYQVDRERPRQRQVMFLTQTHRDNKSGKPVIEGGIDEMTKPTGSL